MEPHASSKLTSPGNACCGVAVVVWNLIFLKIGPRGKRLGDLVPLHCRNLSEAAFWKAMVS